MSQWRTVTEHLVGGDSFNDVLTRLSTHDLQVVFESDFFETYCIAEMIFGQIRPAPDVARSGHTWTRNQVRPTVWNNLRVYALTDTFYKNDSLVLLAIEESAGMSSLESGHELLEKVWVESKRQCQC